MPEGMPTKKEDLLKKAEELKASISTLNKSIAETKKKIVREKIATSAIPAPDVPEKKHRITRTAKNSDDKTKETWAPGKNRDKKKLNYNKVVSEWIDEESGNAKTQDKITEESKVEEKTNYDELVGNWLDQETTERKQKASLENETPKSLENAKSSPEEMIENIATKQMTGELLTEEEKEFYFANRESVYKALDKKWDEKSKLEASRPMPPDLDKSLAVRNMRREERRREFEKNMTPEEKKISEIAYKLAYDKSKMTSADVDFYRDNARAVERLLTDELLAEGEEYRQDKHREMVRNIKETSLNAVKQSYRDTKDLMKNVADKTKTAFEMFGRGGNSLTGMEGNMEFETIEAEKIEGSKALEPKTEPAPKSPEEKVTEFELAKKLFYATKNVKAKTVEDKEGKARREQDYIDAKIAMVQKMFADGKDDEAREFLRKEVEFKRSHEREHGPLAERLKSNITKSLVAWENWGKDDWKARMVKRAISISLIGLSSSWSVQKLADHGVGTASALSGGVLKYGGRKLLYGLGLATIMDATTSNINPKYKKFALNVLKAGAVGGGLTFAAVTGSGVAAGASAAIGYGLSKLVGRKNWSEKTLQDKMEIAKRIAFDPKNTKGVEDYEVNYEKILKSAENTRLKRNLAKAAVALTSSTASLELYGMAHNYNLEHQETGGLWGWIKDHLKFGKGSKDIPENQHPSPSTIETPPVKENIEVPPKTPTITEAPKETPETTPSHPDEHKPESKHYADDDHGNGSNNEKHSSHSIAHEHQNNPAFQQKPYNYYAKDGYNYDTKSSDANYHKPYNYYARDGYHYDTGTNNTQEHENEHASNTNHENDNLKIKHEVVFKTTSGYQNYGHDSYDIGHHDTHHDAINDHNRENINTEEFAHKTYDHNLKNIFTTSQSQELWNHIKDQHDTMNAKVLLGMEHDEIGSKEMQNLQEYVKKVADITNLDPKAGTNTKLPESIEEFLGRAFNKAIDKPEMLANLSKLSK